MRTVAIVVGMLIGLYMVVRAIVEFVVIDYADPASYAGDWGGPTLAGVLLVHSGPGLVGAALMAWAAVRWWRRRSAAAR